MGIKCYSKNNGKGLCMGQAKQAGKLFLHLFLILFLNGCGYYTYVGLFNEEEIIPAVTPGEITSPLTLALEYLEFTQVAEDESEKNRIDYAGDWPQFFAFDPLGPYIRDVSPFMVTYIHHSLALVNEKNKKALRLTSAELDAAGKMRRAAVKLMYQFKAPPDSPDAGTFGYWPIQEDLCPGNRTLSTMTTWILHGTRLYGYLGPPNVSFYPPDYAIPTDADDTATIYSVLMDHAAMDGGPEVTTRFEKFFSDWRDLGQVPVRNQGEWNTPKNGAFLTWLAYRDDPQLPNPNDVDVVLNSNILYALGRSGRLNTSGVPEAIALINTAVQGDAFRSSPDQVSLYYPDNFTLHYCVTRAFHEGKVANLAPAVNRLVEDILTSVQIAEDGKYFWDRGDPHLNTALAASALLNAGYSGPILDGAVKYLISEQDPLNGSWNPGNFYGVHLNSGQVEVRWVSRALTTAFAMETIIKYELQTHD